MWLLITIASCKKISNQRVKNSETHHIIIHEEVGSLEGGTGSVQKIGFCWLVGTENRLRLVIINLLTPSLASNLDHAKKAVLITWINMSEENPEVVIIFPAPPNQNRLHHNWFQQ